MSVNWRLLVRGTLCSKKPLDSKSQEPRFGKYSIGRPPLDGDMTFEPINVAGLCSLIDVNMLMMLNNLLNIMDMLKRTIIF